MNEKEAIGKHAITNDGDRWAIEVPFRLAEPMSQSVPHASWVMSTVSVDVQCLREHVVLTANVVGEQHQLVFNTSTGGLLVEEKCYTSRDGVRGTDYVESFLEHQGVWASCSVCATWPNASAGCFLRCRKGSTCASSQGRAFAIRIF